MSCQKNSLVWRSRWRTIKHQYSNNFGHHPSWTVSNILIFYQHTRQPLGPIGPFHIFFTKELHYFTAPWDTAKKVLYSWSLRPTLTWLALTLKVRPSADVSRLCLTPWSTTSSTCGLYSRSWASSWNDPGFESYNIEFWSNRMVQ